MACFRAVALARGKRAIELCEQDDVDRVLHGTQILRPAKKYRYFYSVS